jgi:hypothetical protein
MVKKLILLVLVLLGALLFISCKNNSTNTNSNTTNNTQTPQPETPKVARIQLGLDNWDDYLSYTYTTSPASDGMVVCTFTFTSISSDFTFLDCQIFINYATGGYHKIPKTGNTSFSITMESKYLSSIKMRDVKGYVLVPQA